MKEYDFKLTRADLDVLALGLSELQIKVGLPVFYKLQDQFKAQEQESLTEGAEQK